MNFVPVSREKYGALTWKRSFGYQHFAGEVWAPLVAAELAKASADMPICFVKSGEVYVTAALLSFVPDRNLYVAPDGRWLGSYVPAWFRSYPFRLRRKEGTTEQVLCVDEAYEGIGQGEEAFFDEAGKPAKPINEILQFLSAVEGNRTPTDLAVAALADAGLIVPWEIKVVAGENEKSVGGVFRVDDKALEEASDEVHLKLRKAGALPIAYAQLLAVGQLETLGRLAKLHARFAADQKRAAPAASEWRFEPSPDDELIF